MADQIITGTEQVIPDLTTSGGVTDHGALTGLGDNDHPQYALAATVLVAGAGMTGGGDLSTGRTFNVVAADSTIVVNADSIQAGVIGVGNITDGTITLAKLANLAGASVLGRSATSAGVMAAITGVTIGHVLTVQADNSVSFSAPAAGGVTDHGALTGLTDDDHTQYPLLLGRSGGQTLIGGTAASEKLILQSTSNATRGVIQVNDDVSITRSSTGTITTLIQNTSNTASAAVVVVAEVGGTSAADAQFGARISGGQNWSWGIDNSDSDSWVLAANANLGSNNHLRIDPNGDTTVTMDAAASRMTIYATHASASVFPLRITNNAGRAVDIGLSNSGTSGFFGMSPQAAHFVTTASSFGISIGTQDSTAPVVIGTNTAKRLEITGLGNVVMGTAAIATTATDGYFYLTSCAGVPTGVPTAQTGRVALQYDSTNNKLYAYNGAWKSVTLT